MVDAVLLVLREVLEAAILLSLLLALSHKYRFGSSWSWLAVALGLLGSWLLARYAYAIAESAEGAGQELLNVVLYAWVVLSLIALALLLISRYQQPTVALAALSHQRGLRWLLVFIVSFSLMREAAEIWLYLSSFVQDPDQLRGALMGTVIGTGIGLSVGAILFYALLFMAERYFLPLFIVILGLLAGGLSMQIAKQLLQIGWLDSGLPLWDSSFIVSEQSWLGELLYALLGYDAQPTAVQLLFYLLAVAPLFIHGALQLARARSLHHGH